MVFPGRMYYNSCEYQSRRKPRQLNRNENGFTELPGIVMERDQK